MISSIRTLIVCLTVICSVNVHSYEASLVADIDVRNAYNDNIFLTSQPHDSVTAIVITPSISGIIKDKHWEGGLDAKIRSNNYSDNGLDGNDQLFNLTGRYTAERNIYSLKANYDLVSNLSSTSTDFGISGQRIERESQSITPQYTRLLSERSALILGYTYTDVDYLDAEGTGFSPYISLSAVGSYIYNMTERDRLTLSLQAVDYTSKNDLTEYQLFVSRIGVDHKFSETFSADFLVGVSRRNSTNLSIESFDFFGTIITRRVETDFNNRGFVLNAGINQKYENASLEGRLSRDNVTNSFGGLNEVDRLEVNYYHDLSSLWSYRLRTYYEDVAAVSSNQSSDRDVVFFNSIAYYSITKKLKLNASYRQTRRKFKSDTSDDKAPRSNRIYVGLTYNFPPFSTF